MSSSFSSISQSIHTRLCLILGWTNIANFNSQQRHDQEQGDVIQFHLNNMLLATSAHYGAHFLQPYSSDLINHHQFKFFLDKHGAGRPLFELFCILNVSLLLMRSKICMWHISLSSASLISKHIQKHVGGSIPPAEGAGMCSYHQSISWCGWGLLPSYISSS